MDIFVAKLSRDNVFLRHHISNNNYQQIKEDCMLILLKLMKNFQLVKGIKPRYIVELYFPPELLLNK